MKDYAARNQDVIVCFVASVPFLQATPDQRLVKAGVSAHDCCKNCTELIGKDERFIVVDDVVSHSQFPLDKILAGEARADVESLMVEVSDIYLGSPSKEVHGKEETK
jgi:hypothetical protein